MWLKSRLKKIILKSNPFPDEFTAWCLLIKNALKNLFHKFFQTKKTQWICTLPQKDYSKKAEYILEVYEDYRRFGNLPEDLTGRVLLEVGPGETLGVALVCLCAGAKKVICLDKFTSLLPQPEQTRIYLELLALLKVKYPHLQTKPIEVFIDTNSLQSLIYLQNTALEDMLPKVEKESVDFVISRAVLEHVENPQLCLSNMNSVLKRGGRMIHEIDFRDHGMFESYNLHPLTMLIFPEKIWTLATSNLGAPNRYLLPFYEDFLKKLDYNFEVVIVHTVFSDKKIHLNSLPTDNSFQHSLHQIDLFKKKLSKPFSDYKSEKLLISAVMISAVKNTVI